MTTVTARRSLQERLRQAGAVAGLVAAGVALGVAELVAAFVGETSSPVVSVGGTLVDASPVWLKDFAITSFGTNDKPVLLASILAVLVALAAATGMVAVRRPVVGFLGVALLGAVGALAAATRPTAGASDVLPSVLGALAGMAALALLLRRLRAPGEAVGGAVRGPEVVDFDRRGFLVTTLGVAAVGVASGAVGRSVLTRRFDVSASRAAVRLPVPASAAAPLPPGTDLRLADLSPFRTPNGDFYRVDTALVVPQVATADWRLRVHGMVDHEIELGFDELLARPMIERDVTLTCVSNEVGGPYVGSARWLGVRLADVLREAGVHPDADQLLSRSADGMTIGTPTAVVMDGRDALLAVGMNGEPLPAKHGFPVRMVVPGLYGYVSATKWVVDLRLTRFADVDAYWVARGWARRGPIKTMSRIDRPRPFQKVHAGQVAVAGVAWAQHRGVERVEVRVDGGPWQQARLAPVPTVDTWRQWVWTWDAPPGSHTIEVRATDRTGATQPERRADPFPSGATGWHSTVVNVA